MLLLLSYLSSRTLIFNLYQSYNYNIHVRTQSKWTHVVQVFYSFIHLFIHSLTPRVHMVCLFIQNSFILWTNVFAENETRAR